MRDLSLQKHVDVRVVGCTYTSGDAGAWTAPGVGDYRDDGMDSNCQTKEDGSLWVWAIVDEGGLSVLDKLKAREVWERVRDNSEFDNPPPTKRHVGATYRISVEVRTPLLTTATTCFQCPR